MTTRTSDSMDLILKYFPRLSNDQKEQFERLQGLYGHWNAMINVISRKDFDSFYERHVLHSLGIASYHKFEKGSNVLDVGTGGGFPGIPLAIFFPDVQFHLVDSIGKKIKVVSEVAKSLDLSNVKAEQIRAEQIKEKYDFVVSRAVTRLPEFTKWIQKNISREQRNALPNGIIYLKGGDLREELASFKGRVQVSNLSDYFEEEFFETKKIVYLPL